MKSQSEIRATSRKVNTWVSPNHGDGGWHTTPGTQQFTTEWMPLSDRLLVRLLQEKNDSIIIRPKTAAPENTYRRGIVLKVGPGIRDDDDKSVFLPMTVKEGDQVIIGQWHDWQSSDAGWGENIVLCREPDVRVLFRKGDMQNFQCLYDRVLLRRVECEQTTSGIIIPDSAKEKPRECMVISIGPGHFSNGRFVPVAVKAGDRVLIAQYGGSEIKLNGEELLVVREDEIQARL